MNEYRLFVDCTGGPPSWQLMRSVRGSRIFKPPITREYFTVELIKKSFLVVFYDQFDQKLAYERMSLEPKDREYLYMKIQSVFFKPITPYFDY